MGVLYGSLGAILGAETILDYSSYVACEFRLLGGYTWRRGKDMYDHNFKKNLTTPLMIKP